MKKLIFLLAAVLVVTACTQDQEIVSLPSKTVAVDDFSNMGELHNSFLSNMEEEIKGFAGEGTEREERILAINLRHLQDLDMDGDLKSEMREQMMEYRDFMVPDRISARAFYSDRDASVKVADGSGNLYGNLNYLEESGLISKFAHGLLTRFSEDLQRNYEGILSDAILEQRLNEYMNEFNLHGYTEDDGEAVMVGTVLAVSLASVEWWRENPSLAEPFPSGRVMLAPWAAMDLAGAVIGGASGSIASYAGTGRVNWRSVGVATVIGAVAGSTGAVGRLGRMFTKL